MTNEQKIADLAYGKGVDAALKDAGLTKVAIERFNQAYQRASDYVNAPPEQNFSPRWAVGSTPGAVTQPQEQIAAPPPPPPTPETIEAPPQEEQLEGLPQGEGDVPQAQSQYDAETLNVLHSAYNQLIQAGYTPDVAQQYIAMLMQRMQSEQGQEAPQQEHQSA